MRLSFGIRKIIKVNASGTNCLSIPRLWLKVTGLKTGNSVSIEMLDDQSLLIRPFKPGVKHDR
jgi:antitoxin component of MazEF toxin-antitoxin module